MIKDRQAGPLRQKVMAGKTRETAAAMAGICERSVRKRRSGPSPSETKQQRWWRTRPDPLDGVRDDEIEPMLRGDPLAS